LRLQAGPFVYSASADGAIIGADGKVIKDKNAMFMFMKTATQVADSLRAEAMKKLQNAPKKASIKDEVKEATEASIQNTSKEVKK